MRFSQSRGRCEIIEKYRHLILFAIVIFVALLSYIQIVKTIGKEKSPPLDYASVDMGMVAGFCHVSSCKIGDTSIREAFYQAPEAVKAVQSNPSNKFITVPVDDGAGTSFEMLIRDPKLDTFISGNLADGKKHDPAVQKLVVKCLKGKSNAVFVDIGANIGYFTATALAVGARTISFEPFYENAGVLMSTIERNVGWRNQSTVYMNPLGYESSRVTMKSTNGEINLSNMHITGSQCTSEAPPTTGKQYGLDYMDGVSLDQVMLTNHRDIQRVQLMKVDVETFEIQVFNGAMHTLCNSIVERIVVEVEYLKPKHNLPIPCDFDRLQKALVQMNYEILDLEERMTLTHMALPDFPTDVIFRLKDMTQSPATRLQGVNGNPCQKFDMMSTGRGKRRVRKRRRGRVNNK
mmetsp:Transcript_19815/g.35018  ORF Transcript_19815/g.35018 Transcript_19815/m.35018 type:complete len:405 (-) Transcript_19815:56-1270(-)